MKKILIIASLFISTWTYGAAEQAGFRVVHFPKDRAVGRLKIWDSNSKIDFERGMISLPGWVLIGQAQGDVNVPAGKDLRLEVYEDSTDISFLAALKPDDLQVLILERTKITDEELVHLKGLISLLGLRLDSTAIEGPGLVHLASLKSLRNLSLFNTKVSDAAMEHLTALLSLRRLSLSKTQINGSGLKHLKGMTSLICLDLAAIPVTDDSLVHLSQMSWLKELQLYDTDISDEGLSQLKELHGLEYLVLGRLSSKGEFAPITDNGLVHLKDLSSLKNLYLIKTQITDAGLAHLSSLRALEALFLAQTQITGEGLAFLKELPALKSLSLQRTRIGGKGLANCTIWSNTLEYLDLESTKISDADLACLGGLKVLKYLNISETPITDAGLVHIRNLSSLENLNLTNTRITDEGLVVLKDLGNLRSIGLTGTLATNSGLANFKQATTSRSLEANVKKRLVRTKEKGTTIEQSPMPMPERQVIPLLSKPLPDWKDLIDLTPEQTQGKAILICFFDFQQRPSRNAILQLAKQAETLEQKGVFIAGVQASKMDQNALNEYVKKYNVPFSMGMIQGDEEKARFAWGVKSLPWLILTDREHIVRAEGFGLNELEKQIGK